MTSRHTPRGEFLLTFMTSYTKNAPPVMGAYLWKIWGKTLIDGEFVYTVTWWEGDYNSTVTDTMKEKNIKAKFPAHVSAWEKKFGKSWRIKQEKIANEATISSTKIDNRAGSGTMTPRPASPMDEEDLYNATPPRKVVSNQAMTSVAFGSPSRPAASPAPGNYSPPPPSPPHKLPRYVRVPPRMRGNVREPGKTILLADNSDEEDVVLPEPSFKKVHTGPLMPARTNIIDPNKPRNSFLDSSLRMIPRSQLDMNITPRHKSLAPKLFKDDGTPIRRPEFKSLMTPRTSNLLFKRPKADDIESTSVADGLNKLFAETEQELKEDQESDEEPEHSDSSNESSNSDDSTNAKIQKLAKKLVVPAPIQALSVPQPLPVPAHPPQPPRMLAPNVFACQYDEYSDKLIKAWDVSLEALIRTAMDLTDMPDDKWPARRKASKVCDYDDFVTYLVMMIAGRDPLILEFVVKGTLPREVQTNQKLKDALERMLRDTIRRVPQKMDRKSICPCIYIHYFVDNFGYGPTEVIVEGMLDEVEEYVRGFGKKQVSTLAFEIDNVLGGKWQAAKSDGGQRRYCLKAVHKETLLEFVKQTKERLKGVGIGPLARTFAEVGYALKPVDRLAQHAKYTSSNYIMNLMEAISMKNKQDYRNRQYVILHCVHPTHGMYGEIVMSRFALGYTTQGGGFSHFKAGVSIASAKDVAPTHYAGKQLEIASLLKQRMQSEVVIKEGPAPLYERIYVHLENAARLGSAMNSVKVEFESQIPAMQKEIEKVERFQGL
jgi:hypothetical protein